MKMDLRGAVAVVTGATGELGTALSHELARHGSRLALVSRDAEGLAVLAEEIEDDGGSAIAILADVTDRDDRLGIVEQTRRHLGPVDILVNNTASWRVIDFVDEDPCRTLTVNLVAPLALTREVVRDMIVRGRGHVLTIGPLGTVSLPYLVQQSASSAGLIAFSTSLAEELRGTGVSATAVVTGLIFEGFPSHDRVPWVLRPADAPASARRAISAMRRRRLTVTIPPVPIVPIQLARTISEGAYRSITRALGVRAFLGARARRRLDYDGWPRGPHGTKADESAVEDVSESVAPRQHVGPL